jgi:hypothetical protein
MSKNNIFVLTQTNLTKYQNLKWMKLSNTNVEIEFTSESNEFKIVGYECL